MPHQQEWNAISARIRGLIDAAHLYAAFQQSNSQDQYGGATYLGSEFQKVLESLQNFLKAHEKNLPHSALNAIRAFCTSRQSEVIGHAATPHQTRAAAIFLSGFETEISYLLTNTQELLRRRTERAFLHLQRSLVVDEDLRSKWTKAFGNGETYCEMLGSIHLLSHGIFAFKIDAKGARTDLIFNEPIEELTSTRASEGLVLTEWKIADNNSAASKFEEAEKQASIYAQGALGGVELTDFRYLVVVSLENLPRSAIPADLITEGTTYRHINVAIKPKAPSMVARSKQA